MKKRLKREALLLPRLLKKIGKEMGAAVLIEPTWGVVGQITFKGGRKRYFRYNTLDLNPVGASDVAKDKDYANFFLKKMGYPTVQGKAFFRTDFAAAIGSRLDTRAAITYAHKTGFPLFVKPNSGSQGHNVFCVQNARELHHALKAIFIEDRITLIQKPVRGRDYRIVVLDGRVISAYERIPLNVEGDGRSTILQLLKKKQRNFIASSRDTRLKLNDPRIAANLRRQKYRFNSVPPAGTRIFLLDNANLSSGGDAVDVTRTLHSSFKKTAIAITKDMGLRLCGVDLMVAGSAERQKKRYWVLEVNAAPGLDHYVRSGPRQEKIVENLYRGVMRSLSR